MNFELLVGRINLIQDALQAQAAHAVNFAQSESRGCLHSMPSQSKVNEVSLSLTARRSTSRSLCLQRTCWWDCLTQHMFFVKKWRMLSAKRLSGVIPNKILRLLTAKLDDGIAVALRGRHPQVHAGEYHGRAV